MNTRTGFTLIEILLVVIILSILAATVIPMLATASDDARANAMRDDTRTVRVQCELYRLEHNGVSPGYPAGGGDPDAATFAAQMVGKSDADGNTGPALELGPYLLRLPINAVNGKDTVLVLADGQAIPAAASDQFGWVYKPSTTTFRSDAAGSDQAGTLFYDY